MLAHSESRDLPSQVVLLWKACRTTSCGTVVSQRLFSVTGHLEQMGAHSVEPVVTGQPVGDLVYQGQSCRRAMHDRSGDGPVERNDRVAGHLVQQPVQGKDLRPVGVLGSRSLVMDGRDRSLELILTDRPLRHRVVDQ